MKTIVKKSWKEKDKKQTAMTCGGCDIILRAPI